MVVGKASVDDQRAPGGVVIFTESYESDGLGDLEGELSWFSRLLDCRFRAHFASETAPAPPVELDQLRPPDHNGSRSAWARFLGEQNLDYVERVALVLAMVPHLRPQLLDVFFVKNEAFDRRFTEFGGLRTDDEFEPTAETLAFVLGGGSLEARVASARLADSRHPLFVNGVLASAPDVRVTSALRTPLRISPEYLELFTTGKAGKPTVGAAFPAQRVETDLGWNDLVLHPGTRMQMEEIQAFIAHGDKLMREWGMASRLRPGHRALFHGPPGTGKTLSAVLLGKATQRDVYRVDLSLVVSKYIGETEKNLARVFDRAERDRAILFFDEADALFGKRTETRDANDRFANQEVAFLLTRLETFGGIAILASNLRENLDDAFMRRFESVVYFPIPAAEDRARLWRQGFSPKAKLADDVDFDALARDHQLSGGAIMNVVRHVSLLSIAAGERAIGREELAQGIRRELAKEGRR